MKEYIKKIPILFKKSLPTNVLTVGMMIYFVVMGILKGDYYVGISMAFAIVLYLFGGFLGSVKKYIPVAVAIASIPLLGAALIGFLIFKTVSSGFVSLAVIICTFATVGYVGINGLWCVPYCAAVVLSQLVICLSGDNNAVVAMITLAIVAIMFTNSTYTSMSKYIFSLFLVLLIIKVVGIVSFLNGHRLEGILNELVKSAFLYVALVILGFASLLLKERHPRFKSDRDKKHVPAIKQWQTVIGATLLFMFAWGIICFNPLFAVPMEGISQTVKLVYLYFMVYFDSARGMMIGILEGYGFVPLFLTTIMIITFVYKAGGYYKESGITEFRLLNLLVTGFVVCYACMSFSVPILLFGSLLAGCVVNGSEK